VRRETSVGHKLRQRDYWTLAIAVINLRAAQANCKFTLDWSEIVCGSCPNVFMLESKLLLPFYCSPKDASSEDKKAAAAADARG
jgi:hypothetical protein